MKKYVMAILLLLSACESAEEKALARSVRETEACEKAGFQPDTPAFEECKLQVRDQEEQRKADRLSATDTIQEFQSNHPGQNMPGR